ncbi:MAG: response regulator [Bacteroidia bacterium]
MTTDSINIHIIDDDKLLTTALKNELEKTFAKYNVEISAFETGEAYELSKTKTPDVAVVDFHLNSKFKDAMNGVTLVNKIKKENPDTEVVMFTSEDNAEIAVRAIHQGVHDYVVKNNTMFRKLNMAVYQCMRLKELKEELRLQKKLSYISVIIITLLIGVSATISLIAPHLL